MKYIITGDLHLSAYSSESIVQGIPENLYYTGSVLKEMILYASNNSIFDIIIGGDIFHNKSILHVIAQSYFLDFIRKNINVTFYIINGNHDMSSSSGKGVSALKCLDSEPNVKMFHESILVENIYFVPWNPYKMIEEIRNPPKGAEFLISHLGLNEAMLNSGISIISDISLKDVSRYKHCFLSHYHKPQEVGNVTYVGSPTQRDWGERNEDKRFIVFDSEEENYESVSSEGYKKYFEYDITRENKEEVIRKVNELSREGHIVRLNKMDIFDTDDIKEYNIIDKVERDLTNRGITSSMSMNDKMKKYLEIRNTPEELLQEYMDVGISIINDFETTGARTIDENS